jgi:hypothetical protein
MKKLLLTLAAVVGMFAAGSGNAWADTAILSHPGKDYKANKLSWDNGFTLQTTGNTGKTIDNSGTFTIDGKSYTGCKLSNTAEQTLTIPDGYSVSSISVYCYVNNTDYSGSYWASFGSYSYSDRATALTAGHAITAGTNESSKPTVCVFNFDGGVTGSLTFKNAGNQPIILLVIDYAKIGELASPAISSVYNGETGKYDVTLSCATEGATLTYKIGDGESTAYNGTFEADAKSVISVTATLEDQTKTTTQTLDAVPTLAAPTYTISQNAAYRTWKVTFAGSEGATINYTIDGNTVEYKDAIEVGQGVTISATASKKNYTTSTATTFTTKTYPTTLQASETTEGGTADVAQDGFSYTINSTYVAGAGARSTVNSKLVDCEKYLKLRTNKTAGNVTGFRINVVDGYTITGMTLRGYTNKTDATTITDIQIDGTSVADFSTITVSNTATTETLYTTSSINATKTIDFAVSGGNQAIFQLDFSFTMPNQIIPVTLDKTVGYATYYGDQALIIPSDADVNVYTGTIDGENLILSTVSGTIPANTAVILKGEAGKKVEFPVTSEDVATIDNNALKGVAKDTELSNVYVLSYKTGLEDVGFYKASSITLPANKVYVEWPAESTVAEAPMLRFNFGETEEPGNVTGVNAVTIENRTQNVIYDLRGRRVLNLDRPGLYIVNGKKVAIQ